MKRHCVLIVEDDRLALRLYSDLFQMRGHLALQAAEIDEARQLAREVRPNLIILDVGLPDGSGIDLCRSLKAEPRTGDIPILIITYWPEFRIRARAAGCDGFLVKPVPVSKLLEAAGVLLSDRTLGLSHPL